ncbi:MAG: GNAT family N-acyltransferase [Balneolaceae bacterium]
MEKELPKRLVTSNKYLVRLAENEHDVRKAQSLRYCVFNLELGEGLEKSHENELDIDKYDDQCDHLLVVERDTDQVIGTYRMQTYKTAKKNLGFYTDDEFNLGILPDEALNKSVEVGRACIHKDHRNGRVLYLLWRGIAEYMKLTDSRYLFGCCSITSTDPKQGWIVRDYLSRNGNLHGEYCLETKPNFHCPEQERDESAWQNVSLPQLFCLYMDLGAKILSKPALDREFKTIDFLILLDVNQLDERSRALFFK